MQEDDSLHVVPAPIGKKRIPVSVLARCGMGTSPDMFNGLSCLSIESMQCMQTVKGRQAISTALSFYIRLVSELTLF